MDNKNRWILKTVKEINSFFSDENIARLKKATGEEKEELFEEFTDKIKAVERHTVNNPGALIYLKPSEDRETIEGIFQTFGKNLDQREAFDALVGGHNLDFLMNTLYAYINRASQLTPTFISTRYHSNDFRKYFNEAMEAWTHGLDNAALIMIYSVLEEAVRNSLCQSVPELCQKLYISNGDEVRSNNDYPMSKLIEIARDRDVISYETERKLKNIGKARNSAVHNLDNYDSTNGKEVYQILLDARDIIEDVYKL
ncbi:hypothetical protein LQ318_11690 [Aliifodinibius salicampi]|uniref:DUF4145 domain-containing protein n=1 Tax=Fodinibius salicampi TaxID=1920655 RepID=A0ABT3Q0C3_9BACT|nr:hypothetical protein [Fodinibius salicampi]MCW9713563.1 hypothetical protein [Fodinibius salicampi]